MACNVIRSDRNLPELWKDSHTATALWCVASGEWRESDPSRPAQILVRVVTPGNDECCHAFRPGQNGSTRRIASDNSSPANREPTGGNMRCTIWSFVVVGTLLAALAIPVQLPAQDTAELHHPHQYHHYQLIDVGTFGGPNSSYLQGFPVGRMLNNSCTAVGSADTPTPDPYCASFNFDCYVGPGFK